MNKTLKNIIGLMFLLPAGAVCSVCSYESVKSLVYNSNLNLIFGAGIVTYIVVRQLIYWAGYDFIEVAEILVHELMHGFFALLFLGDIKALSVSIGRGGEVSVSKSNFLVELSPYCFPALTIFICVLRPFFIKQADPYIVFFAAFFLGLHICSLVRDFHFGQRDLINNGIIFSFSVVLFFNVLFIGIVAVCINSGISGVPRFMMQLYETSKNASYYVASADYTGYISSLKPMFERLRTIKLGF